uniref:Uncharacterized protein n=1 Tax=Angiostrongylus cantonensis TaxID=6313 RepID=A0A0K0D7F6_ANGCA
MTPQFPINPSSLVGVKTPANFVSHNFLEPNTIKNEIISNTNINFTDNGEKMQFAKSTTYIFNASKSCAKCDPKKDTVTVPDISFFIGMQKIDAIVEMYLGSEKVVGICQLVFREKCAEMRKLIEREIGSFLSIFNTQPFVTVTVDELLFSGYISPLVTRLGDRIIDISNALLGTKYPPIDEKPFIVMLNVSFRYI